MDPKFLEYMSHCYKRYVDAGGELKECHTQEQTSVSGSGGLLQDKGFCMDHLMSAQSSLPNMDHTAPHVPGAEPDSRESSPEDQLKSEESTLSDLCKPENTEQKADKLPAKSKPRELPKYTAEECLSSEKGHPARNILHYIIRKACKEAEIWGVLRFSEVPANKKAFVFDRVVEGTVDEMKKYESQIDVIMRRMMINSKAYTKLQGKTARRTVSKKSTEAKDKSAHYEKTVRGPKQRTTQYVKELLKDYTDTGDSTYSPGDTVFLHDAIGNELGEAVFLKQRNELFCELAFVKLTEHKDAAPDINLFEIIPPVPEFGREQKTLLVDLESDDFFIWKSDRTSKRGRTLRSRVSIKKVDRLA